MHESSLKIEERVASIEARNARVEREKAWETSYTRIVVVSMLTYFVAVLLFLMLGNQHVFLNALVPTVGFLLSVQSVPFVKRWWMK